MVVTLTPLIIAIIPITNYYMNFSFFYTKLIDFYIVPFFEVSVVKFDYSNLELRHLVFFKNVTLIKWYRTDRVIGAVVDRGDGNPRVNWQSPADIEKVSFTYKSNWYYYLDDDIVGMYE